MDSDEETDFQPSWRGVPGTIILINAFENSKHNIYAVVHAATCRLIRQHMRLASSQNIGVCIFGTEESTASNFDTKPVIEIIPLSIPSVDDYNKLKKTDITSFKEAKEFKLSDALWHCSKMFANCKRQLSTRTVIILTRLDTPPIADDKKPTTNRATDLADANIDIKIINVSDHGYSIDPYYKNLWKIANKGIDIAMPEPVWDVAQIEKLMYQESHRHLAVAKLNFEIGKDFNIGVGVYTLLKRPGQSFKKSVNLDRDTNTPLTSVTKTMKEIILENDEDENVENKPKQVPLLKSELLYYQEYGGERVEFTDKEMKMIRNPFGPPMMKLLGFKPATIVCKEKWYLKMGYFLFPNESIIEGSTVAFRALHKACSDTGVVAICVLSTRINAKPLIVALNPCSRPLNLDIDVGFDVIIIPFVESVRELKIKDDDNESSSSIENAHKKLLSNIINNLTVDFKPDMFENPKVQYKYRAIEAIALEDEDDEPLIDTTKLNPEKFEDIDNELFEELFGPFGSVPLKRAATAAKSSKKQKVDDIDEDLLSTKLQNKKINDYTVPQLKQILKYKDIQNLPALTGLKKSELVELVYKHCK